jgi:hypothetical protein
LADTESRSTWAVVRRDGPEITVSLKGQVVNQGTASEPICGRIGLFSQESVIGYRRLRLAAIVR